VLVNTINFTESSLKHAQTAETQFFLTVFAQLAATIKASKSSRSRLRQTPTPLKLNQNL
jgi:hypothetical protein